VGFERVAFGVSERVQDIQSCQLGELFVRL
jgi:hypothetical protein